MYIIHSLSKRASSGTRQRSRSLPCLFAFLISLGIGMNTAHSQTKYQDNNDNNFIIDGYYWWLSYTGSYRDFIIPDGQEGHPLFLEAQGGDGGKVNFSYDTNKEGVGGGGAELEAKFMIGSGPNQIPVGSRIRFIVGQKGQSHTNNGENIKHGAGGGGATGVLFLPPNLTPSTARPEDWVLLMVAGGGGGGYARWGGRIQNGLSAEIGEIPSGQWEQKDQVTGDLNNGYAGSDFIDGTSDLNRWGGGRNNNTVFGFGGGGTGYQTRGAAKSGYDWSGNGWDPDVPIGDAAYSTRAGVAMARLITGGGFGGFQKVNGVMQPVGHKGAEESKCNSGGYGFGSGGLGMTNAPGAGGGYAGGLGAANQLNYWKPAGGGSSYINMDYALPTTVYKAQHGTTTNPGDGSIRYRVEDPGFMPVSIPATTAALPLNADILRTGNFGSGFSNGTLVLYEKTSSGFKTQWSTDTAYYGRSIRFADQGDLQILDSNSNIIWHTDTANRGNELVLEPYGKLYIRDTNGTIVWSAN